MKTLKYFTKYLTPLHINNTDKLHVQFKDTEGIIKTLSLIDINHSLRIESIFVYELEDEYGLSKGFSVVFGETLGRLNDKRNCY